MHKNKEEKEILPSVTHYQPLASNIKKALMKEWNLIQANHYFANFLKNRLLFPWERKKNMAKGMLIIAKILKV